MLIKRIYGPERQEVEPEKRKLNLNDKKNR